MTNPKIIEREWVAEEAPFPSETDFDPYHGDLDAQCAWKNFGGLTRIEAYERFLENPDYYQEDFMFMGSVAFRFYFPVIERFLLEAAVPDESVDRQAWILAHCIQIQWQTGHSAVRQLAPRILALTRYVRDNLKLYSSDEREQREIDMAWSKLEKAVSNSGEPSSGPAAGNL